MFWRLATGFLLYLFRYLLFHKTKRVNGDFILPSCVLSSEHHQRSNIITAFGQNCYGDII